jgi:glutamate synthase (NADPH/NADH) large chain
MAKQGVTLPPAGEYGVGMVLPAKGKRFSRVACEEEIERAVRAEGQVLLGWRDVPVAHDADVADGQEKRAGHPPGLHRARSRRIVTDALERKLYVIRRASANAIKALRLAHSKEFYVTSLSARTIVYKGLLLADQVGEYLPRPQDPRCVSALALVHQRFSTNTFPSWKLAHPFRMIAHNGEINTLRGNVNWMRAREQAISSPLLGADLEQDLAADPTPASPTRPASTTRSNCWCMGGYSLAHAMMMLIPEAWAGTR